MRVSLPSIVNLKHQKNVFSFPPQYPSAVLVLFPSALRLPKFMGFISLSPMAQQYASFPSLNLKHPKHVLPPSPSIPKHCIGFISLSFETPKIYGFHFLQPHGPTICEFPFPQLLTLNTKKMCFPSPLNTQALYWFCFPQL